ncbi:hypothetical protein GUITHDRAFT_102202 [Guillardia theta CCMP2712]|uniref:Uncharacterized protein n=1 Tax=Guillardia theta (strain CCMP2712) TaxID=905079 RepID=L1JVH7_GUITC|nr:hypothetical protein GUITHDRAFT_102202 [Guillardia theta CCMP2712]EKX52299.1 hypothetical protein GUITHDRAFT_102202 [Guillardia theta CCMP2712]|eukprot:XP_005839279.1 hypothetical protein GUITHDRAFT_102202 [Guillardia theta CCMP2712]
MCARSECTTSGNGLVGIALCSPPRIFQLIGRRVSLLQMRAWSKQFWQSEDNIKDVGDASNGDWEVGEMHVLADMRGVAGGMNAIEKTVPCTHGRLFAIGGNKLAARAIKEWSFSSVGKPDSAVAEQTAPTRMDAIRSWLTANCARVCPGKLVCDPFAGSGALLQAATDLGASFTLGSDVQCTGAVDVVADISRCPWVGKFDAIVCDPPYGRRAGQVYYGDEEVDFGILSSLLRWAEMAMAPGARLAMWWWESSTGSAEKLVSSIIDRLEIGLQLEEMAVDDHGMGSNDEQDHWQRCIIVLAKIVIPPEPEREVACSELEEPKFAQLSKLNQVNALSSACWQGNLAKLKESHRQGISLDEPDKRGRRPLLFAAGYGKVDAVEFLCNEGKAQRSADPHAADADGNTASFLASMFGHLAVLQELPAACLFEVRGGWTTMHHAAQWGKQECMELVIGRLRDKLKARFAPLSAGTETQQLDGRSPQETISSVREFVSQQDMAERRTALHLAACYGHISCCEYLLSLQADPTVTNCHGETPLDVARMFKRAECVKIMEKYIKT